MVTEAQQDDEKNMLDDAVNRITFMHTSSHNHYT